MSKADEEEWRDIIGYEGKYQVSNFGRIKSLCRVIQRKNGHIQTINERILKPAISNKGYYMVSLDGKTCTVHRLEALAFLGKSKLTVNHINGIKTDNRIENLELVTHKENCIKAWQTGLCENVRESAYKIKHKRNIKTSRAVVQTDLKGNIINKFVSIREAEEKTGIQKMNYIWIGGNMENMSDEEKKAIKEVKHFNQLTRYWQEEEYEEKEIAEYITTILNLIEKQSKEIEELKEDKYRLEEEVQIQAKQLIEIDGNYISKEESEQKERKAYIKGTNVAHKLCNKMWKDKIKAKIEEVSNGTYDAKIVLQELLEKE